MFRNILFFLVISCLGSFGYSQAYLLGFKSRDNSIENIQQIEEEYGFRLPIVSFIFDPYGDYVEQLISKLPDTLGNDRIYHISLSPNSYTAKEVADGKFDTQYKEFFALVKSGDLKVIFRTMHEMNGGRYPRSSNPKTFKLAWIHVWNLARNAGITAQNVLFDFSLNAWDLPARNGKPSQTATFIQCTQTAKVKLKCPTFEDYYPGDKYVDLMGVTFYNRGKGNSNRRRGTPRDIVNAKGRNTLDRIKKFNKPIFVDEVGTTAVNYEGAYSHKKSLEVYNTNYELKNTWLRQLRDFLKSEPSIVGANYFNVDLTSGLRNRTLGELDWSVIDFQTHKFYEGILDVISSAEKLEKNTSNLLNIFNVRHLSISGVSLLVPSQYIAPIRNLYQMITSGSIDKINAIQNLENGGIRRLYKRFTAKDATAIANILREILAKQEKLNKKK